MATEIDDGMIEDTTTETPSDSASEATGSAPVTPAAAGLSADDIGRAVAAAMKKPENEGKTAAEVKKDMIDELLEGKEVDVDKSYVAVLKHFQGANKALEAQVKALTERLSGVEGKAGNIERTSAEQALVQRAGGAEAHQAAKDSALAATHEIMGTDPKSDEWKKDPSFLAVANAQYNKIISGKTAAPVAGGKPAIGATPASRAPSKPITNTKVQGANDNTPAARMAKLRQSALSDD